MMSFIKWLIISMAVIFLTACAPTADAGVDQTIVEGESVTLQGSTTSSDPVTYQWSEGEQVLSNLQTYTSTDFTVGEHTVTLRVTNDAGEMGTDEVIVTVKEKPDETSPVLTLIGDANITLVVGNDYIEAGATASDNKDGDLTQNIKTINEVNSNVVGIYTVTYNVSDNAGNKANEVVRTVNIVEIPDETPPVITLNGEESVTLVAGETYTDAGATANDNRDGNITADINTTSSVDSETIGTYVVTYNVSDTAGNQAAEVSRTVIVTEPPATLESISITPDPINLRVGNGVQVSVTGLYSDGTTSLVEEADYAITDANIASVDTTGYTEGLLEGSTMLRANVGNIHSLAVPLTVGTELNTTNFNFTNFGSAYVDQIPLDVTIDEYDEKRFCMIVGDIVSEDGSPLQGVRVTIFSHDEYGSALTDANGTYVIPSEGGLQLIMRYTKNGYTSIDRKIQAPVQDWVRTPNVTMLQIDTKVTLIDLNSTVAQIHVSTPVIDERGERSTTLVFDGVSKATVTSADGTQRELTNIQVRATEFKTPESMPSDLPRESAYTYCSDLVIDGTNDTDEVTFDAPVVMYVENFLGFEVGEIVPVGYYDRKEGRWKASDNGAVVRLLDTDGDGRVDALDSNGSGTPNDLDGDGSFEDEVAGIQDNPSYVADKSYWRTEMTHFTPWDCNWPYGPPEDADYPNIPNPDTDDDEPNDCGMPVSSYVTKKTRVFHEDIPIAGTDITLHYSSKRVDGYKYIIESKVDTSNAPKSTISAMATLNVAGKLFTKSVNLGEVNQLKFKWDGRDILDSKVNGEVTAKLTISYKYNIVYYRSANLLSKVWAKLGSSATTIGGRGTINTSVTKSIEFNINPTSDTDEKVGNGWALSNHDTVSKNIIIHGDGSIEKNSKLAAGFINTIASINGLVDITVDIAGNLYVASHYQIKKIDTNGIISVIAGAIDYDDNISSIQNGSLAIEAQFMYITGVLVDKIGNIYISHTDPGHVFKVNSEGIINIIAGDGKNSDRSSPHDGLATDTTLNWPSGLTLDNDGNLYIADSNWHTVRKVDVNGIITTVAGTGHYDGDIGDGGSALAALLFNPNGIVIDNEGNLYIADSGNYRIRKVDKNGIISTIAGNGIRGYNGDGIPAIEASLAGFNTITLDVAGNLYIADSTNHRIRKVDKKGIINTIMGNGSNEHSEDGRFKPEASLSYPHLVFVDIRGNFYIGEGGTRSIRKILSSSMYESYNSALNEFMYLNKNNTADIFTSTGKHLKTIDLTTSNSLKEFSYDEDNYLSSITDNFNQTVSIARDAQGNPTSITAPNGQVTTLTVDENGNLTQVSYEDSSTYEFTYYDGSLMDVMRDPNGNTIKHIFNENGRIVEEIDGGGGTYSFLRNVSDGETLYSSVLPEGETSTSKDVKLSNGDTQSLMTLATGETLSTTFTIDEKSTSSLKDGVSLNYTYTSDYFTQQKILASKEVIQPSGLKNSTTYVTTYATTHDGNRTHEKSKTQTILNNSKPTTIVTDYTTGLNKITSPLGKTTTREYDINTLLTSSIQSGTLTPSTFTYNEKGKMTTETTGERETTYTYDPKGNLATITDPKGQSTTYEYDVMARVTKTTYPNSTYQEFSYDNSGNLLTRVVPTPAEYTFAYNAVNQRVDYISPLSKATTYTYDRSKNLTSITKPSGKVILNSYTNGRLTQTTSPETTTNYSYLFADKLGSISNATQSISYEYDGELLTSQTQSGVLNQTINYTYNNDFLVTSSTYAEETSTYTYDNDGLLTQSAEYTLTRDADNGYTTKVTDNTLTQTREYNNYGEVTKVGDNTLTYSLSRNKLGAITSKTETLNVVNTDYNYTYDTRGRLLTVSKNNIEVEDYTYDNNGNRVNAVVHGVNTNASYTLDDNLEVYGDNTYRYDEDGYLIEKTTPTETINYTYNTLGALTKVQTPTKTINYHLNALNQRVAKEVNGVITEKYLWANLTTLLAIYDKDDNLVQRFNYIDQRIPISMTSNGTKYYLHYDQVGTLRTVSNNQHQIVKEITYDTYGNILLDTNPNMKVPFGFAGGLHDRDTNLVHFGYREYDPYTGKWTAKDPIDFSGGDSNLYGYVLEDPVNLVDPEGLSWMLVPIGYLYINLLEFTYDKFDEMINGEENLNILNVCTTIAEQYNHLIKGLNNTCMDSAERTIMQQELNHKKVQSMIDCMKLVK